MRRFLALASILVGLALAAAAVYGFVRREELLRQLDLMRFAAPAAESIAPGGKTLVRMFESAAGERPFYMVSADLTDPARAAITLMGAHEHVARSGPLDPASAQFMSALVAQTAGARRAIERGDPKHDDMCVSAYVWRVEIIQNREVRRFIRTACVDPDEAGYKMVRTLDAAVPTVLLNCAPVSQAYGLLDSHQACLGLAKSSPPAPAVLPKATTPAPNKK